MNQKTSQGTSLHRAALFGKVEVVKLLLEVVVVVFEDFVLLR